MPRNVSLTARTLAIIALVGFVISTCEFAVTCFIAFKAVPGIGDIKTLSNDPLRYTPQTITDATIHNGQTVHTAALKCNVGDHDITVSGQLFWVEYDPSSGAVGQVVSGTTGLGPRPVGCISRAYSNPMPDAVIAINRQRFAAGMPAVTWVIEGIEHPVNPDGKSEVWSTTPFRVVP